MSSNRMSLVFITLLLITMFSSVALAETKSFDFRHVRWGMSMKEVKIAEAKQKLIKEDKKKNKRISSLSYETTLDNILFSLLYLFADDKLYAAIYTCAEDFADVNKYLEEYHSLRKMLTKLYNEPYQDKTRWEIELYKNDKANLARAYSLGHVATYTTWNKNNTELTLRLAGKNGKCVLDIDYGAVGELNALWQSAWASDNVARVTDDGQVVYKDDVQEDNTLGNL